MALSNGARLPGFSGEFWPHFRSVFGPGGAIVRGGFRVNSGPACGSWCQVLAGWVARWWLGQDVGAGLEGVEEPSKSGGGVAAAAGEEAVEFLADGGAGAGEEFPGEGEQLCRRVVFVLAGEDGVGGRDLAGLVGGGHRLCFLVSRG